MSKYNYKVSVIVPVYNVEQYIANSINSLLNQTYKEFQIILIDDGSTDHSIDIANDMLKEGNIEYKVITQSNQGLGYARNAGIDYAAGEWLIFLDSDDTLQPFTLEHYINIANKHPDSDIIFSDFQNIQTGDEVKPFNDIYSEEIYDRSSIQKAFLLRSKIILAPGTMYRVDFINKNSIRNLAIRWSEDQHFIWRSLLKANKVIYTNCVLYNYLIRPNSIMTSSKTPVMLDAYHEFQKLSELFDDPLIKNFLLARWVFGCIHSCARICLYDEWKSMCLTMDYKTHLKTLRNFPIKKIRAMTFISRFNIKLMYFMFKNF